MLPKTENAENKQRIIQIISIYIENIANTPIFTTFAMTPNSLNMKTEDTYPTYTHIPPCPCCCSAYMEEHETYWVCPVCGAIVDKS